MFRAVLSICCLALSSSFCESRAQESTAEDFQAFGELWVGRWTSEVTLITDFPGLSKKAGQKLVVYNNHTWTADKKAILDTGAGGETTGVSLWGHDPAAKRIFCKQVGSSGSSFELTITKETDSKWNWEVVAGGLPDGGKFGGNGYYVFAEDDDGKTLRIVGDVTIDGVPTPHKLDDTHHRLDK